MAEPPAKLKVSQLLKQYVSKAYARYRKAPPLAKAFVWLFFFINLAILSLIIYFGPSAIAQTLYDIGQGVRKYRFGWLILLSIIAVTSFPPLIGWSTTITVCGFAYGIKGWFVAAGGVIIGAAAAFAVLRYLFHDRIRGWSQKNKKWVALETVIRARGLPLIILIRLSPFPPWVYANLLFASIESVSFIQFMLATIVYTPIRLVIPVWIGSRVAKFSDGSQREEMDTMSKILNALSIVLSIVVALSAGWVTWHLTEKEIRKIPGLPEEQERLVTDALVGADEPPVGVLAPSRYTDDADEDNNVARSGPHDIEGRPERSPSLQR